MRVCLDDLRPEMVLDADIVDAGGRLLLPTGTVLTEKHLRYCQMWGIADAEIAGDEQAEDQVEVAIDPVRLAATEDKVSTRFVHTDRGDPAIDALFRYLVAAELRKPA